ncbi:MAG: hypothetical protein KDD35_04855 [Bdellovibrionales bacterium]|nr:hypothetical protein [Bdellovibrionales bacterium]
MEGKEKTSPLRFDPGPEVKAFIFQQIQDLEPMLENMGSLGVFIEKTQPEQGGGVACESENYSIRLIVAPGGTRIEALGESNNIFEACIKAKDLMVQRLSPFINALRQSEERDGLVHYYAKGGRLH